MPTCGTIVPLRRAQKCPLNRIRRSHVAQLRSYVAQLRSHVSRFRSHDFLFRSHKRQMRSEKATLLAGRDALRQARQVVVVATKLALVLPMCQRFIENIVRHHLSLYDEDFEGWRKL